VIQNSLERLLAGIAQTLRETVRPAVADPYAAAQTSAAADLLDNLARRVEWRRDLLLARAERVGALLERAGRGPEPVSNAMSSGELAAALERRLAELAELQASPPPGLAPEIEELLRWLLEDEDRLIRSGMYRS
jgi:hypothetical protein